MTIQFQNSQKRKDMELDIDFSKIKKIKQEETTDSGSSSPIPSPAVRDPEKWNPARLTQDTLFIMGSHAHKVSSVYNYRPANAACSCLSHPSMYL